MSEYVCRGLEGSWLNAWLAGVGATVLDPELRLRWSDEPSPKAILCAEHGDPVDRLVDAWPTRKCLAEMPLAEQWGGTPRVKRKVSVGDFRSRVQVTRSHPTAWTLSSTLTDLHVYKTEEVAHAPLDPPAPRGIWLHKRLVAVHAQVERTRRVLRQSLDGVAQRVQSNGLGFDLRRVGSAADQTKPTVDPVVEVLAFFGLALLPMRGDGTDERIHRRPSSARQRGWARGVADQDRSCFQWPTWSHPLDPVGIDALLDIWEWRNRDTWSRLGVHGGWRSVRFRAKPPDVTRAYGSEPI